MKHKVAACTTGHPRLAMSTAPVTQAATNIPVAAGSAQLMIA